MQWLTRLEGSRRVPAGREWAWWKRLPAILAWGTALPLAVMLALWWAAPAQQSAADESRLMLWVYQLAGLIALHWTLVGTLAIGCVIVMVMKGPGYVADPYPPPGRDDGA